MENPIIERKHSLGLIIFLVLMVLGNSYSGYLYVTRAETLSFAMRSIPITIHVLGFFSLVNVCLAILVFLWIRAGVYGIFLSSAIAFIINIYLGVDAVPSIVGLLGAVIIYFATRKTWNFFE